MAFIWFFYYGLNMISISGGNRADFPFPDFRVPGACEKFGGHGKCGKNNTFEKIGGVPGKFKKQEIQKIACTQNFGQNDPNMYAT